MAKDKKKVDITKDQIIMEAIWKTFAEVVMEMMTKEQFVQWYETVYVPQFIEEAPDKDTRMKIKVQLIHLLKSADKSLGEAFKNSIK
jgi:hypothetical protein